MEPFSLVMFLTRHWKKIMGAVVILILVLGLIGAGMHYKGLLDNKAIMTSVLEKKDVELKNAKADISAKDAMIGVLNTEKDKSDKDIQEYMKTVARLQKSRNDIQGKYNELLEKINNVKLPLNEKGTLSQPVVLINAGLPDDYIKLKQSTDNNNTRHP